MDPRYIVADAYGHGVPRSVSRMMRRMTPKIAHSDEERPQRSRLSGSPLPHPTAQLGLDTDKRSK